MVFLNILNKIFGPKKPLSRHEIQDYKDGEHQHEIEIKAASSAFNEEALEGWKETNESVAEGMKTTDEKMAQHLNSKSNNSSKNGMLWTLLFFTLVMTLLIIFTYQGNKNTSKNNYTSTSASSKDTENKSINELATISSEKMITSSQIKANQEEIKAFEKKQTLKSQNRETKIHTKNSSKKKDTDTAINNVLPIQSKGKIPNETSSNLKYNQAKEVYLSGLKNVDYRAYRSKPIKERSLVSSGLPANKAAHDQESESPSSPSYQTKEYTYFNYLSNTAEHFSKGKFKIALRQYLEILDTYPKDVNANFYGGLCYFNLGEFKKAQNLLRSSYTLGYGNFRQEARWFIVQAHLEQNNFMKARYLLKKIVKENGFYSQKAQEKLKELE
ncbi:hypothetical protein CW751_11480 [Brumimicrobium salinarum]|uniref:Uncharacterized protein n=1 Tax=Brumimicrobium salinarum TaxID=2058658 RepID=A0A2I0R0M9_9FLAO|nr:hypothetical protein [Brumimicrobium salinarum]PKR80119.1 hypothetical protein CW751_11480 [Brumimicrobium salinarum]